MAAKLFPHKRVPIDTIRNSAIGKANDVLMDAFNAWTALNEFRRKAKRNKEYTFGDQWSDRVVVGGKSMTERAHILKQGNIPLQNNRIRGIVRSVVGVFQSSQTEPVCIARDRDEQSRGEIMSTAIQYVYQLNKLWGLDGTNFQYFLISGLAAYKSNYGWRNGKMDVWTDTINYNRFFFDPNMEDSRHWDCRIVGDIVDIGLYDAMAMFADGDPEKAERIKNIYGNCSKDRVVEYVESVTRDKLKDLNFFIPIDNTKCRVINVWKREAKERLLVHDTLNGDFYKAELNEKLSLDTENNKRVQEQSAAGIAPEDMRLINYEWLMDNYWYYYYLSPQGDVLKEGETPFWHGSHPYSFKVYPFYDNQVFPFVGDIIDQQRYINRLIMLQDFVTRSSAKGVLAIDEESIPEGSSPKDFADEWAVFNGVIVYTSKGNSRPPQQIVSNSTQLGVTEMLSIQLKLLEDISGVQGALQGRAPSSGTPASLYAQQVQNSATSLTELFESFRELREARDTKNMKLIQQFYTEPRYINIAGSSARREQVLYTPETVRNSEFDLSIVESTSTPAYRMVMNEFLMNMWQAGAINVKQVLENGSFPFADKLLQSIKAYEEEAQQAGAQGEPGGFSADMPMPEQGANSLVQQMFNPQNTTT